MHNIIRQYLIHLSYFGTQFSGVVKSKNIKSIGTCLNDALLKFLPTIQPFGIFASSRTDKGVHAFENTLRFLTKTPHTFNVAELRWALNYQLSDDKSMIRIHQIKEIESNINIIDSVNRRTYLYRIGVVNKENYGMNCVTAWENNQIFFVGKPFNIEKFTATAVLLSGQLDYSGFTNLDGTLNTKSTVKNLEITISKSPSTILNMDNHPYFAPEGGIDYFDIFITADSFMNKMVRYLIGCMVDVARGKLKIDTVEDVVERGTHYLQVKPFICAPPNGLYLYKISHKNKKLDFDIHQWKEEMNSAPSEFCSWKKPVEIINENFQNELCVNIESDL